ncbi:hypothetical protein TNIN_10211 [Trichonephila inaurata madagascariensis]|uniref:Uncharacterized protein n=1 Tax=Trichonephila inaurata madagascariensis TaxID=2747483 RepID=A0A8X7CTR1_9ARAC|nr:hypothetical protein TNIN_10211 [Trichonephila inaurata madagascariensis]
MTSGEADKHRPENDDEVMLASTQSLLRDSGNGMAGLVAQHSSKWTLKVFCCVVLEWNDVVNAARYFGSK